MRVLVAAEFPETPPKVIGGIQAVTWELVQGLTDQELSVHVSTTEKWWREPQGRQWQRSFSDVEVRYHSSPKWLPHVISSVTTDAITTRRDIRAVCPDLVHAHGQTGYAVAAILSGLPCVITPHGIFKQEKAAPPGTRLMSRASLRQLTWTCLEDWILRHAPHVIVISPYVREQIGARTGGEIHVLPNPVAQEFFLLDANSQRSASILTVGWLIPRKRQQLLIAAMPEILRAVPNAELRIVGNVSADITEYGDTLRQAATDLGIERSVTFLHDLSQEALLAEYEQAAVYAHAAVEESSPMAVAQAMAASLPVVAVDIPGVRHLVHDGVTGTRVSTEGGASAVAAALVTMLQNAPHARGAGAAGRVAADGQFRPDAVSQRTREIYEGVIRDSGRRQRAQRN